MRAGFDGDPPYLLAKRFPSTRKHLSIFPQQSNSGRGLRIPLQRGRTTSTITPQVLPPPDRMRTAGRRLRRELNAIFYLLLGMTTNGFMTMKSESCSYFSTRKNGLAVLYPIRRIQSGVLHHLAASQNTQKAHPQILAPQLEDISIAKYWELIKRRPYHLAHKLSPDAASRAFNALTLITSYHIFDPRTPISPFSKAECKELCEILLTQTPGQGHDSTRNIFDYRTYTVASILEKIYAQRHWRRAALVEHRLEDGSSRSGSKPNRIKNYLKKVVSLVLLEVPVHYEKQIERATRVRIDREMPRHVWREIINKLKNEWSLFIAISAVLLASTVATLAIPGIDSLTRLFAGIAAQCAFSSIVMGISLLWQYVGTLEDDGIMGAIYFKRDPWGIACLQALPLAALLWSLATFAVAGCIYPFRSRDGDPAAEHDDRQGDGGPHSVLQPAQKGIAGITMGLLAIAILAIFYDVVTTKHGAVKADSPKLREIVPQTGNPVEQAKQAKQAKQAGGGAPIVDTPSPSIAVTIRSESPQGL